MLKKKKVRGLESWRSPFKLLLCRKTLRPSQSRFLITHDSVELALFWVSILLASRHSSSLSHFVALTMSFNLTKHISEQMRITVNVPTPSQVYLWGSNPIRSEKVVWIKVLHYCTGRRGLKWFHFVKIWELSLSQTPQVYFVLLGSFYLNLCLCHSWSEKAPWDLFVQPHTSKWEETEFLNQNGTRPWLHLSRSRISDSWLYSLHVNA